MNANMRRVALAAGLVAAGQVMAQTAPAEELDTVVVRTGTRLSGLKAEDSPAPVQVLDGAAVGDTVTLLGPAGVHPAESWVGRIVDAFGQSLLGG